jgi:hypothetical protein
VKAIRLLKSGGFPTVSDNFPPDIFWLFIIYQRKVRFVQGLLPYQSNVCGVASQPSHPKSREAVRKVQKFKKTFVFEQISGIIFLKIDFSDTLSGSFFA